MNFYGILTPVGIAKQANAMALGLSINITELAVCDGNGADIQPPDLLGGLIGQWRRKPINQLYVDPQNPAYLVAEQVIPPGEGGKWIRGMGLFDEDGDLVAVANCPPTYKPLLTEGAGRTQVIRMVIMVGNTTTFSLKIDSSVVLATRKYVDDGLANLDAGSVKRGILPVPRGGTGVAVVPTGTILIGNGAGSMVAVTFEELRDMLGIDQLLKNYPRRYSIFDLPTANVGPSILVEESEEVWRWQETPFFEGYRSKNCGRPMPGHTLIPLPDELDGVGGLLSKAAYPGLWGYVQENNLLVTDTVWQANIGAHWFVDVDAEYFRCCDIRNQFIRLAAGAIDIDTANVRGLGSRQADSFKSHSHGGVAGGAMWDLAHASSPSRYSFSPTSTGATGGAETRGRNVGFFARLHAG